MLGKNKILKLIGLWVVVKIVLLSGLWIFMFSGSDVGPAQAPRTSATPPPDKIDRPTSDPYTGDLARFDRENRAEKLQIQRVMDELKVKSGSKVADIGAGGGWFTVIAAKRVGDSGTVYANDIRKDALTYIENRGKKEGYENIRTFLGTFDDPKLPEEEINAVLILNTYHEVSEPVRLMRNMRKSLAKDAMIGIIDRDGDGDDHGIDRAVVKKELARACYEFVGEFDFVKDSRMDYFLVFTPMAKCEG